MPSSMKPAIARKAQLTLLEFLVHMPDLPGPIRELRFSPAVRRRGTRDFLQEEGGASH